MFQSTLNAKQWLTEFDCCLDCFVLTKLMMNNVERNRKGGSLVSRTKRPDFEMISISLYFIVLFHLRTLDKFECELLVRNQNWIVKSHESIVKSSESHTQGERVGKRKWRTENGSNSAKQLFALMSRSSEQCVRLRLLRQPGHCWVNESLLPEEDEGATLGREGRRLQPHAETDVKRRTRNHRPARTRAWGHNGQCRLASWFEQQEGGSFVSVTFYLP